MTPRARGAAAVLALATSLAACDRARPFAAQGSASLHGDTWVDVASPAFHAYYANRGLAACTFCHGPALQGEGRAPGCGSCHDESLPAGVASWRTNCLMCHGGLEDSTGAPPRATWGNSADPARVGAHSVHVGGGLSPPFDCVACHVKPADALSPGHVDGEVLVTAYQGADPVLLAAITDPGWDRRTATCASAYCHGATLAGGTLTQPTWSTVDGTQAACGTCHGLPPAAQPSPRHPIYFFAAPCVGCHPGTAAWGDVVQANGIVPGGGLHVNAAAEFTFAGHPPGWVGSFPSPRVGGAHAAEAPMGCSVAGCGILMSEYYQCASCHGRNGDFDPTGGSSRVSCGACHPAFFDASGRTSCTFCH